MKETEKKHDNLKQNAHSRNFFFTFSSQKKNKRNQNTDSVVEKKKQTKTVVKKYVQIHFFASFSSSHLYGDDEPFMYESHTE